MRSFFAVVQRELQAYFVSPLAWVILTFFLFGQGLIFSIIVSFLNDPRQVTGATPFDYFFNNFFFWLTLLFITPVITMRLIAEERRSGTLESLMTAPITEAQVVLGKFLAAAAFYAFLWLPTALYPLILSRYSAIDWGPIASGYLGVFCLGCTFLSIGLFGSSFTKNQIVAAVATFFILVVLFIVPWIGSLVTNQVVTNALGYINLIDHIEEFAKGIVDSRRLVYYATTTAFFLFLTTRALEAKKWR